ncbi:phosphatidate cytidylyltransferase [Nocardioides sp. CFH 31398]|uniref:phosphatidate cytidylyltransferase n=1 Tax=Nocardioides sp. CFH 31398 TaxID=2919579 RepID=UPI001F062CAD|nr:phosphatidate cytidylyltransferase [Nocardioides sp. CFH 31398]MCH1866749.1 phosphatidate cytidylyltransferase [Nocardioides sp. CFH 31398]
MTGWLEATFSPWRRWAGFDTSSLSLDVDLGPLSLDVTGRAVFLFWVTLGVLALAGLAVAASRRPALTQRWTTWALIVPVVGLPIWAGRGTTAVLAAVLAVVAVREYARLARLTDVDRTVLLVLAVGYPVAAWLAPDLLGLAPLVVLLSAVPSVLGGDLADGVRRSAMTAFGSVWICWSLAHLVLLWEDAYLVAFAAAAADVAAWCGGTGLRRLGWARRPLSPLSPNKTVGGLLGAVVGTALVLTLLGELSLGLVLAVGLGGVLGDLVESMVKRQAGVKDAGGWLPGFGGLLDRVDSLLLVLPLAAVLTGGLA